MWIYVVLNSFLLVQLAHNAAVSVETCFSARQKVPPHNWKPCAREKQCMCSETKELQVSCKNQNLTKVPARLPDEAMSIDLSYNMIINIGSHNFSRYVQLKSLNLAHNKLKTIPQGTFDDLAELECLSLERNSIRYNEEGFQVDSFKPLKNLRMLKIQQGLTDVKNETYSLDALKDLQRLEVLYLDGISNQKLGRVFQNLKQLKVLIFKGIRCIMPKLPVNFFPENTALTNITFNHCEMKEVEEGVFKPLTNLRYVDLSNNLDLTFNILPNITNGLNKTNFETLKLDNIHRPYSLCVTEEQSLGFKNLALKELYLDSNKITGLEQSVVRNIPTNLKTISVRGNAFMLGQYVREMFSNMSNYRNLETLIMSDQFRNHHLSELLNGVARSGFGRGLTRIRSEYKPLVHKRHIKQHYAHYGSKINNGYIRTTPQWSGEYVSRTDEDVFAAETFISNRSKRNSDHRQIGIGQSSSGKQDDISQHIKPLEFSIPKHLRYVDASNMKYRLAITPCAIQTPNNLQEINLSLNTFYAWLGPMTGFGNLTKLDLSWNSCTQMDLNFFENMTNLRFLNLSRNFLGSSLNRDLNGKIFKNQQKLHVLDLSKNGLFQLQDNIFDGLRDLRILNMSENRLNTFQVDLTRIKNLTLLDLSKNQLESIDEVLRQYVDNRNLTLNLGNNLLKCDCARLEFVKWMAEADIKFKNRNTYVCDFDGNPHNISSLEATKLVYNELKRKCFNYTPVIVAGTAAFVMILTITVTIVMYRYRWNIR